MSTLHICPQPTNNTWEDYPEDRERLDNAYRHLNRDVGRPSRPAGRVPIAGEKPYAELWQGASLVKFSRGTVKLGPGGKARTRGVCGIFNGASRRRLRHTIGKIRRDVLPGFLTLTYPDEFPVDWHKWKRDRVAFEKRLYRKFPHAALVHRLELKRRKSGNNAGSIAPHFHALVWGVPVCKEVQEWISQMWYEVVGSGDEKHLAAGTSYEGVKSWNGVMHYCAKYLSKMEGESLGPEFGHVGRWWGVTHREFIPWGVLVRIPISLKAAKLLIRSLKRRLEFRGPRYRHDYVSLSGLVDADFWLLRLGEIAPGM